MAILRFRDENGIIREVPALKGEKGDKGDGADAYIHFDTLQEYAQKIQEVQTPNTFTISLMADTHFCENDIDANEKLDTANKMSMLSNYVHIDAMANLGDFIRGDEEKNITRKDLARLLVNTNQNAKCPVFYVRGNHDDNGWYSLAADGNIGTHKPDEMFNDKEWYQWAFGFSAKDMVIDKNKPYGGYGYFDHAASKVRVFVLNSSDIPYVLDDNGEYRYNSYQCMAFSNEQINFVANGLKFEDKENPNEWAAMFLSHVPLDATTDDGYRFGAPNVLIRGYIQMLSIIESYRKGIAYSFSGSVNATTDERAEDFPVEVSADYIEKGCGDVICFVNGHTHIDNASQKVGREYNLSYGYTYLSVIGSSCFATIVIDREKSVANVFKYGWARSPKDSTDEIVKGIRDGESELGIDISSGSYVVPFEQFRPTGESIYNGISEITGDNYFVDTSVKIDLETLELPSATANEKYVITKGVFLKQNTQYIIPNFGGSNIYAYHPKLSNFTGTIKPTAFGEELIFTSKKGGGPVVFCFHKDTYPDYANFYIKEWVSDINNEQPEEEEVKVNLFNGLSELWGDGYFVNTNATLNTETLELSTATEHANYAISKAVAIKSSTQYEVPVSDYYIYCFSPAGNFNGTITPTDGIFTSKASGGYLVFCFHKNNYPDYENFYIYENQGG